MRSFTIVFFGLLCASGLGSRPAAAQDEESSPEIELGSSRIGGPGLTESERRWVKSWDESDEVKTEANIPPPGDEKRLPHLHYLAKNYVNGKAWREACEKYDLIEKEGGMEAVEAVPIGKKYAARAFFQCGKIAFNAIELDKAERLLAKSERFGPSTPRHAAIRLKIKREAYRKKMVNGDVEGALKLFSEAQQEKESEDERIWMGQQLATLAWTAYKSGDEPRTESLMRRLETVSPMNTEYRRLKDKLEAQNSVFSRLVQVIVAAIAVVILWNLISAWRARSRVGFKRNKFDVEDV